ncbi:hypothetical protein Tco_0036422 [Tanacetum coccineum]
MFESGSYRSQPKHVALYEALEASMKRDNRDAFLAEKDKSHKRRWDDQDPPPPPSKELDQSKKKKNESDASNISIPDDVHVSDIEDTDAAHLLTIKPRPDWLKPVSEEQRPETPEPDWAVPLNDLPKPKNNWANAFSTSYKDPEENKLFWKISDMGSFIKWFCRQIEKSKLSKADLEGPTYKIDLVNPEGHRVVPDVSKPLPLGGPPGSKERRSALSISKLKASNYPEFGLEELVPSLWIESK